MHELWIDLRRWYPERERDDSAIRSFKKTILSSRCLVLYGSLQLIEPCFELIQEFFYFACALPYIVGENIQIEFQLARVDHGFLNLLFRCFFTQLLLCQRRHRVENANELFTGINGIVGLLLNFFQCCRNGFVENRYIDRTTLTNRSIY